ncbi:MAG: cupin domain-containing protein [Candidatus Nitrohelix vancouverensis]|uniref:Cupin domain-containing protein n=1 Tax=Candidatus Nitrohelix vancouverensis TaxID=2705534 RepID=A0A7T0G309_9BACT|nr:MAG: cupin domain-containing protein [Candidatus Nitrohelix vancouverensis]
MRYICLSALFVMTSIFGATSHAQEASGVNILKQLELPEFDGKEAVMLRVDYAPGESTSKHRHNAHTFVYVLEGSVMMQVEGGAVQVFGNGETFYESPDDIHSVSRNASATEPASFLVFFIKNTDAPILLSIDEK